jgi:hypothetical protein
MALTVAFRIIGLQPVLKLPAKHQFYSLELSLANVALVVHAAKARQ